MKVKITKTIEVNDDERMAIAAHYGKDGKAPHALVVKFISEVGSDTLHAAVQSYYRKQSEKFAKLAGEK